MFLREYPDKERYLDLAGKCGVVPVCEEILADSETPVSLLGRFYRPEGGSVFLLESVEGGERWGRYSFLGINEHATVRLFANRVEVEQDGDIEFLEHNGDPLNVLRKMMKKYTPAAIPELPRFWGGLVGCFTYESVSFFEKRVPNKLPENAPLGQFIIPSELLIFDNVSNSLAVVVLTFPESGTDASLLYDSARKRIKNITTQIKTAVEPQTHNGNGDYSLKPVYEEEAYREKVRKTKELIIDGEIIQAVVAQPFECDAPDDLIALYRAQRYINPSPYMYFMKIDDTHIIGSSPETMVRLEGRTATVRPIAGTRPRGATEQEDRAYADDLLKDEKERAEHLMLVDLGRNDLGRVSVTGTVQVTDMMIIERYSHVMHLVSNVECELQDDKDALDLFAATFPAGTLSGAPKVRAMEIIADFEEFYRGPYGGAVGYLSFNGNMDFAITIRTAVVQNGRLWAIAGAGLVYDSDPEKERQETVNKAMSVQKALEMIKKSISHS